MKKSAKTTTSPKRSRRVKCACASCVCTVNPDTAVRRGNLVFCGQACAAKACTIEDCHCEHDSCAT
ncbi:MAG TPA: conjugal transfer protein TrbI [Verrucomicrobiae bacterium]|nr:conjugal transfer protein TrbI [Verrucomicrobiae bacterium]